MQVMPAPLAIADARGGAAARAAVLLVCAVGAVYWLLGLWWATLPVEGFVSRAGLPAGGDFIAFWGAARLAVAGDPAAPYDIARFAAVLGAAVPSLPAPRFPWAYPPFASVLLRPLGWLDPAAALALWYAVAAAGAALAARLVAGTWRLAPLAVVFPPVAHALTCGQNGPISAALLAAIASQWSRAPAAAGAALGVLAYKPQFAAVAAVLAVTLGAWRVLGAAAITVAVLSALSLALDGLAPWLAFAIQAREQLAHVAEGRLPLDRIVTVFALARSLGIAVAPAFALQALSAIVAIAACIAVWRRSADAFLRALALVLASALATPYAFDYDLAILLVPAATLFAARPDEFAPTIGEALWFAALALTPVLSFVIVAGLGKGQVAAVALLAMLAALAVQARAGRGAR